MKKSLWYVLGDGTKVFLVEDDEVKAEHDIDFTEGGNHYAKPYIPFGEIWIGQRQSDAGQKYTLAHELKEEKLMSMGMPYDKAHDIAAQFELSLRRERYFEETQNER